MIFGVLINIQWLMAGGIVLFVLLSTQMLVGMRVIRFKGRTHQRVHRLLAWTIWSIGLVHGALGIAFAANLSVG